MKFGLSEDQLRQIRDVLSRHPKITEAVIFGSRAMGNYKEASDVDIALKGDVNSSLAEKVKAELEENTILPFFFDVVAYLTINDPKLTEHIDQNGISIHRRGWQEFRLTQIGSLARGKSRYRPRYAAHLYGGKYPFVQTGEIKSAAKYIDHFQNTYSEAGLAQSKLWPKGTLCITIAANIAEIAILKIDACFPDSVLGFLPDPAKCDLDFIFYTLKRYQRELQVFGDGSVQDNINLGTFEQIEFPIPELPEQHAIAGVLSSLDDKIDLLHRQNKTLEGMAAALWRKMFVEEANSHGVYGKLADVAELNPTRPLQKGSLATYLDMANMPTLGPFPLDWYEREYRGGMRFKNGDTIIARITPCLENGKTAFVNFLRQDEIGWGSTEYIVMAPKNGVCPEWLYFLARNNDFREFAIQNMTGTSGRQRVSWDAVAQYELPLPPNGSMEKFGVFAATVMEHIRMNSLQVRTLSRQRDTLLPKLISGEVAVKV